MAAAINNDGVIVGGGDFGTSGSVDNSHAFIYNPAASPAVSDLGTLPGHTASAAYRVNRYGHAAGFSGNMLDTAKPVLFNDGSIEEIGALSSTAVWGCARHQRRGTHTRHDV